MWKGGDIPTLLFYILTCILLLRNEMRGGNRYDFHDVQKSILECVMSIDG